MINDLRHRWGITRSVFQIAPERMRESSAEHDRIIELLAQKDYDELERFTRIHKFAGSAITITMNKPPKTEKREGKQPPLFFTIEFSE